MVVIDVRVCLEDDIQGAHSLFPKELEESLTDAKLLRQVAVDQSPSIARKTDKDRVSVAAVEDEDLDCRLVRTRWAR